MSRINQVKSIRKRHLEIGKCTHEGSKESFFAERVGSESWEHNKKNRDWQEMRLKRYVGNRSYRDLSAHVKPE